MVFSWNHCFFWQELVINITYSTSGTALGVIQILTHLIQHLLSRAIVSVKKKCWLIIFAFVKETGKTPRILWLRFSMNTDIAILYQ